MANAPPQGRYTRFLGAITSAYVLRVDISSGGANYRAQACSILNQDASIVVTVSFDGVTDHVELDPADAPSFTFDAFTPPNGTVYLKAASGTPRCQIQCWA